MGAKSLKIGACAALAAGSAAFAGAALFALVGGAPLVVGDVTLTPMAAGYDMAFVRLMTTRPSASDFKAAEAVSRKAIALYPYDIQSWLRLAFVDVELHGALTPSGQAALLQSYDLAPLDQHQSSWRIWFALEHWDELSQTTQNAARFEAVTLARNWMTRPIVAGAVTAVQNPVGRSVGYVWLQERPNSPYL